MPLFAPENGTIHNAGLGAALGFGAAKLAEQNTGYGAAIGAAIGYYLGMPPAETAAPPPPPPDPSIQSGIIDTGMLLAKYANGTPTEKAWAKRQLAALGIRV